jgi:hypothetical protein
MSDDTPQYSLMNERRARELIAGLAPDGNLFRWPAYGDDPEYALLDGDFSADELEAIAWWMRNKK